MGAPKTRDGKAIVATWPTEGSRAMIVSPNWCDPCTWYRRAVRVVSETPTTADRITWQLSHETVIDAYHGRISGEDSLVDSDGNSYRTFVYVDDVLQTERDPHVGSGGDYTVDYPNGRIVFASAVSPSASVSVTYHYANGSEFVVGPDPGKTLKLVSVEAQFSGDIDLRDSVVFQPYGYAAVFAPHLGLPAGTKIPLGAPSIYKRMADYINEANGAHPAIAALGGASWRGCPQPVHVFDWDYVSVTDLNASLGMEVRVKLQHEVPFGGHLATATFYCLSVEEAL